LSPLNVRMVACALEDFNRRDLVTYDELYTPDYEWFPALTGTIEGRHYKGRAGLETWFEEAADTWESFIVVADELRDLDDSVLGLGRIAGRGRGSGLELDAAMGMIVDFRDGRISRTRNYLDHGEALRAAGVSAP
jgi:ketosteroid isomerase-like protein